MKKCFFILLFFISMMTVYAQKSADFSGNDSSFLAESQAFFLSDKNASKEQEKKAEEVLNNFSVYYSSASSEQQRAIAIFVKQARISGMKQFPDFVEILRLFSVIDKKLNNSEIDLLLKFLLNQTKIKKIKNVNTIVDCLNDLIDNSFIYSTKTLAWKSSGDFHLKIDDDDIFFDWNTTNLTCYTYGDSCLIRNTGGFYNPLTNVWIGEKGFVGFERAGYTLNEMQALLNKYQINVKSSRYTADSVIFFNKIYFQEAIPGKLEDKVEPPNANGTISYPKFESYENELVIKNVFPNTDFQGNYRQTGNKSKSGSKNNPALLTVYSIDDSTKNKFVRMTVSGENFLFSKERFTAPDAFMTMFIGDESIDFPICELRFDNEKSEFAIVQSQSSGIKLPIQDNYHKLSINVEAIYWNPKDILVDFRMLKIPQRQFVASFESLNAFSPTVLEEIMKGMSYNPIYKLQEATKYYRSNTMLMTTVAEYFNMSETQAKILMFKMLGFGLIGYNSDENSITVRQKLFDYMKESAGKMDFDVITIYSDMTNSANATLNLKTNILTIFGVESLLLSQIQNVYILPENKTLKVGANRSISFGGLIHCGKFDFETKNCFFDYDKFSIDLGTIANLSFYVKEGEPNFKGEYKYAKVNNIIQDLAGYILIDSLNNKSGKIDYKKFPAFIATKVANVYFNAPDIVGGIYDTVSLKYVVDAFELYELNKLDADKLRYTGHLESSIFPTIYEDLRVMPDKSFGFVHVSKNLPAYGNKAIFHDTISLSNNGLRGSGSFDYNYSTTVSKDFLFKPLSMEAESDKFFIAENAAVANYPKVNADKLKILYQSDEDKLLVSTSDKSPAFLFDNLQIIGTVTSSRNKDLIANGKLLFPDKSEIISQNLIVRNKTILSDEVSLRIFSKKTVNQAFYADNLSLSGDFNTNNINFISNNENQANIFNINKFISYLDLIKWSRNDDFVELSSSNNYNLSGISSRSIKDLLDMQIPGAKFISIDKNQDSLQFVASNAELNLKTEELKAKNVSLVYVADIAFQPNNGEIIVSSNAKMQDVEHAKLLLNCKSKLHELYDANISVKSKSEYKASAYYDYIDKNSNIIPVFFNKITVNQHGITTAKAEIAESAYLQISNAFSAQGDITLNADEKLFHLDGGIKIEVPCEQMSNSQWIAYQGQLDPHTIQIDIPYPLPSAKNKEKLLGLGFFMNVQGQPFVGTASPLKTTDKAMTNISGTLLYDDNVSAYKVEDNNGNYPKRMQINPVDCSVSTYSNIDLNLKTGKFNTELFGSITNKDSMFVIDAATICNFHFNEDCMNKMVESLKFLRDGVTNLRYCNDYILSKIDNVSAEKFKHELSIYGNFRALPSGFNATLLFSKLNLKWDAASRSWYSVGDLEVASIGKENINRKVKGYVQFQKAKRGDVVNIYIQANEKDWYFFSYSDGFLQAISSDKSFNDVIGWTKQSARTDRTGAKNEKYEYTISSPKRRLDFLRAMAKFENQEAEEE